MNKLKTEKYDHIKNISYSNSINDDYNNDTHDKNDDIILTEVDIKKRLGYNKNSRSSYASYPANDPCEDRIAIINKPSYRIGKNRAVYELFNPHCRTSNISIPQFIFIY